MYIMCSIIDVIYYNIAQIHTSTITMSGLMALSKSRSNHVFVASSVGAQKSQQINPIKTDSTRCYDKYVQGKKQRKKQIKFPITTPSTELDLYNKCTELARHIDDKIFNGIKFYCKGKVSDEIINYRDSYVDFGIYLLDNFDFHTVSEYYHLIRHINNESVKVLRSLYEMFLLGDKNLDGINQQIVLVTEYWTDLAKFAIKIDRETGVYYRMVMKDLRTLTDDMKSKIDPSNKVVSDFEFTWKMRLTQIKYRCYDPSKLYHDKVIDEATQYYSGINSWFTHKPLCLKNSLEPTPEYPSELNGFTHDYLKPYVSNLLDNGVNKLMIANT